MFVMFWGSRGDLLDFFAERALISFKSWFGIGLKFLSGVLLYVYLTTPVYN